MSVAPVAELDAHALYPIHSCGRDLPLRVECQTRYLRDALQAVLDSQQVVRDRTLLGWDGDATIEMKPAVLVYHEAIRGHLPEMIPARNPHPFEANRYCMLAIDIGDSEADLNSTPLPEEAMEWFGLPAYLHFDVPERKVIARRFVDKTSVPVAANNEGRYLLADLNVGFGVDGEGFLRVFGPRGGTMPTYSEAYALARKNAGRQ